MDSDAIEKLARLAGLSIDGDESEALTEELEEIVGYVERIGEADTKDVEPTVHPVPSGEFASEGRADEEGEEMRREDLMANAPSTEDHQFCVPGVVGSSDEEESDVEE